jgi:Helix-turn-helix domain
MSVPEFLDEFLDTKETADFLRCHFVTVKEWRCQGKGPPYHKIARKVLYRRSDLEAWLKTCCYGWNSKTGKIVPVDTLEKA